MTISQAGTGSGASGEAVRNIYQSLYGVQSDGSIDNKKALLPSPQKDLPKIQPDGSITAPKIEKYDPNADQASPSPGQTSPTDSPAATVPSPTAGNRTTRRGTARPRKRRRILT
jgi:penicillin-binding protein 2